MHLILKLSCLLIIIAVILVPNLVIAALEPTKIVNNGIYKLEIQSEDKWLTWSDSNNAPVRAVWRNNPEQKWRFSQTKDPSSGEQAWTIAPLSNNGQLTTVWKVSYVGHGKYRFRSYANGLCLHGPGSSMVIEARCEKDSPGQRWLVLETQP